MKEIILKINEYKKELITTALESGYDAILTNDKNIEKIKGLARINVISENGDLKINKDVFLVTIKNKEDEIRAAELGRKNMVIVRTTDWNIIPLENLIAKSDNIFVEVDNIEKAKLSVEILEKGVRGIVLETNDIQTIIDVAKIIKKIGTKINLIEFSINKIEKLPLGDRVCIDTCSNMYSGQGMLIGNSSSGLFLVNSESEENPYVNPRPFRVNAGGVHSYILMPENKTSYLSELKSGTNCLIVNYKGETEIGIIGRVKIEKRPMLLISGKYEGNEYTVILQNAETIKLVQAGGKTISVVELKQGDKVLGYIEKAGRHFGEKIEEKIIEK
ncbi:MAG TPA: 3-dehydroquinate synthase II [bacterium]|nr:3-dehydroquinate synthase II [bacterium]HOL48347.1 3-dehydroquinate synthase II [bacterium]HPQ19835.1 3-dehydroquinate synthase II [bacterium]